MKRKRRSGYSAQMQRCAACGGRYDASETRQIRRLRAMGVLILCDSCWHDVQTQVKRGRANLGALLEELAERYLSGRF